MKRKLIKSEPELVSYLVEETAGKLPLRHIEDELGIEFNSCDGSYQKLWAGSMPKNYPVLALMPHILEESSFFVEFVSLRDFQLSED